MCGSPLCSRVSLTVTQYVLSMHFQQFFSFLNIVDRPNNVVLKADLAWNPTVPSCASCSNQIGFNLYYLRNSCMNYQSKSCDICTSRELSSVWELGSKLHDQVNTWFMHPVSEMHRFLRTRFWWGLKCSLGEKGLCDIVHLHRFPTFILYRVHLFFAVSINNWVFPWVTFDALTERLARWKPRSSTADILSKQN